jgi:hypothetical protein
MKVEQSTLTPSDQASGIGLNFEPIELLARQLCNVEFAAVCLVSDDNHVVLSGSAREGSHASAAESFGSTAIHHSGPIQFNEVNRAPRPPSTSFDGAPLFCFRAGIPVMGTKGVPIGALCVFNVQPRAKSLSKSELQSLQILAAQVETLITQQQAIADSEGRLMRLEEQAEELLRVAEHDPLTALPNRALSSARLNRAVARSIQDQTRFALIIQGEGKTDHICGLPEPLRSGVR